MTAVSDALPAAGPSAVGAVSKVRLDQCWRRVGYADVCLAAAVEPLGLCKKHLCELRADR